MLIPTSRPERRDGVRTRQRRIVFWSLLVLSPLMFIWAANYYVHPARILLLTGVVIVAAFIIRPGSDKRR